jgi:hypothetical protein
MQFSFIPLAAFQMFYLCSTASICGYISRGKVGRRCESEDTWPEILGAMDTSPPNTETLETTATAFDWVPVL